MSRLIRTSFGQPRRSASLRTRLRLVWLTVVLTYATPLLVQRRRLISDTDKAIAREAGKEFRWMRQG
jgi:hypothetical protein